MKNNISNEYARALFEISCERGASDSYYEELRELRTAFESEREYIELLCSPNVTTDEKADAVSEALEGRINDDIVSLLKLLSKRGRAKLFFEIFEDFQKLYNESKKVMPVRVTSAIRLTDAEREKLKLALEKKHGIGVELECKVDKGILGGIIVEAEDSVTDGSLKRKLRDIKEVIKS